MYLQRDENGYNEVLSSGLNDKNENSDVGEYMIVTRSNLKMFVSDSLCWWLFVMLESVTDISNRSPTSQACHKYTFTNIEVTSKTGDFHFYPEL